MIAQDTASVNDLRYSFHPKSYLHAPGYPRLEVFLQELKTEHSSYSQRLQVDVVDVMQPIRRLIIQHGKALEEDHYRICAGRIIMATHQDQAMHIFTFGADLQVRCEGNHTICIITSTAPILPLDPLHRHEVSFRLAEEIEGALARRHAAWRCDPGAYEERLIKVDPHKFYCTCLAALSEQFRRIPYEAEHESSHQLTAFLNEEISTLQERREWPSYVCSLDELL